MFSPLSAETLLSLAACGAEGETRSQIEGYVITDGGAPKVPYAVQSASSVWLNTDNAAGEFLPSYVKAVKDKFNADVRTAEDSKIVGEINAWASEKTHGKINEIISDSQFDAMLINAVYFKGAWKTPFDVRRTAEDTFTLADGTVSKALFMNNTANFDYAQKDGARVVELPYKSKSGESISMYVILGGEDVLPEQLIQTLRSEGLFETYCVNLSIPKLHIESVISLKPMLRKMGIERMFDQNADFSSMVNYKPFYIFDVLQKTYIDVDETYTEAAAVTGGAGGSGSMMKNTEFKANRPFELVIYDNANEKAVFIGRVSKV